MGVLTLLLTQSPSDASKAAVRTAAEWARDEQAVATLVPHLMTSVMIPNGREKSADGSLMTQRDLYRALHLLYESRLKPHFDGERCRFNESVVSDYRNGKQTEPDRQLPFAFLVWLDDAIETQRFSETSPVMRLLALFNPLAAVEAHVASNVPLPRFEPATPASPMLRSAVDRKIDEAERDVSDGLKTLLGLKDLNTATVRGDFYGPADAGVARFMLYRRAVATGQISKAFLVIQAPKGASDLHSFMLWRRAETGLHESRGFIFSMRSHHMFIGATGSQPRGGETPNRPPLTDALKAIIINRNHGLNSNDIWPGLALTHGPTFVPIAARCVLMRAGPDHSRDADLRTHLPLQALEADMRKHAAPGVVADTDEFRILAQDVNRLIDNAYQGPNIKAHNPASPIGLLPFTADPARRSSE